MKETTKELIEWIKESLPTGLPNYRQEAIYFLDSLPEIESHLCRGGYIQDRNGTPCCDGELVYFLSKSQKETYGHLIWDKKMARFVIEVVDEKDCKYIIPELEWFEKVDFEEIEVNK